MNDEKARRLAYLLAGFVRETLTPEEREELEEWVSESDENLELFKELTNEKNIEIGLRSLKEGDSISAYERIHYKIPFRDKKKVRKLWAYLAAASIIILIATVYFFAFNKKNEAIATPTALHDIPAGTDKAVLTLSNGKTIFLQDRGNGNIINENGINVMKVDSGQIAYSGNNTETGAEYNTLTTPKGGQFQITLSDGTKVWLNAASSLHYPVAFSGKERSVEVEGEAYFEVKHDPDHPFHVQSRNQAITVLGTRFNVNAYSEESAITTTLLEGKIELSTKTAKQILSPGDQFYTDLSDKIIRNMMPDIEGATAWKDGWFHFKDQSITDILKQVGRWYNADVIYQGQITGHFDADIPRKVSVSQLLKALEGTGKVHFTVEGKTIKVYP